MEESLQGTQMHSGGQGLPSQVEVLTKEEWRRLGWPLGTGLCTREGQPRPRHVCCACLCMLHTHIACGSEVSIYMVCDGWGVSMYRRLALWEGRQGLRKEGEEAGRHRTQDRERSWSQGHRNPHRTLG